MEDVLVELARECARTCHVLKTANKRNDVDRSSSSSTNRFEDLERCVDSANPSLPTVTGDIRIVCRIESAANERTECTRDLRVHHPGSTKGRLIAWCTGMREILGSFDVRDPRFTVHMPSKPPRKVLGQGGAPGVSGANQHVHGLCGSTSAEHPAPASVIVRYR